VVRERYRRVAGSLTFGKTSLTANGHLKPGPERLPATLAVSGRVNSSKADADDATLIERVALEAAWRAG
jgi:hypothetical protein